MNANIYIDSKKSVIRVEGPVLDVAASLGTAIAQILEGYFPGDVERQLAWVSGISYASMKELSGLNEEDTHDEAED